MERCLQVLDCAVFVVSGTDGIQGHTRTLWKLLEASEPQQADPLLQALAALPEETGDWNEK